MTSRNNATTLLRLVDSLFAGVLEDPPWVSFLEQLEDSLPCHHTTIVMRKPRSSDPGILISPRGNTEALSILRERMFRHSPFLELPEGKVCLFHEMQTPDSAVRDAEYLAYLKKFGTTDLLGLNLADAHSGMTFRLRCARSEGEAPFGARERNLINNLLPRLQVAFATYGRLIEQRNQLYVHGETSERMTIGSLLIDQDGAVIMKNAVADRLLEQRDGLCIEKSYLRCLNAGDERGLRELIRELAQLPIGAEANRSLKIKRAGEGEYWSLLLRPADANIALGDATIRAVMVFIREASDRPQLSAPMLIELFGLTRAEAALALQLAQGKSLDEAAALSGISRYTARAQLASVFDKTETHRQPQLVGLILNTLNTVWR